MLGFQYIDENSTVTEVTNYHQVIHQYPYYTHINNNLKVYEEVWKCIHQWIIIGLQYCHTPIPIQESGEEMVLSIPGGYIPLPPGIDIKGVCNLEDVIFKWRYEAELNNNSANKGQLTEVQVREFVNRFMPAYYACLPGLYDIHSINNSGRENDSVTVCDTVEVCDTCQCENDNLSNIRSVSSKAHVLLVSVDSNRNIQTYKEYNTR